MLIKFNQTEETDILKEFYKIFTSVHINDFKQIIKNIMAKVGNIVDTLYLNNIYHNDLHSKNVGMYFHQQAIDTTTPSGRAMILTSTDTS